jgi:hypothetical protein
MDKPSGVQDDLEWLSADRDVHQILVIKRGAVKVQDLAARVSAAQRCPGIYF